MRLDYQIYGEVSVLRIQVVFTTRKFFLVLIVLCLQGCAIGNQYDYRAEDIKINVRSDEALALALAVHDRRPYIVRAEKTPNFIGLQRGGYGNPFDVTTLSGEPLANDLAQTIATAFERRGYSVEVVTLSPSLPTEDAIISLFSKLHDKSIYISMNEWKTDTYANIKLIYDVTLRAYDANGEILVMEKIQGQENLGGSFVNPTAHAMKAVPEAYRRILVDFLNRPNILQALE